MRFGEKLRELRVNSGKTLQQVSTKLGISLNYLSEIERGKKPPLVNSDLLTKIRTLFYPNFDYDQFCDLYDIGCIERGEIPTYFKIKPENYKEFAMDLRGLYERKYRDKL